MVVLNVFVFVFQWQILSCRKSPYSNLFVCVSSDLCFLLCTGSQELPLLAQLEMLKAKVSLGTFAHHCSVCFKTFLIHCILRAFIAQCFCLWNEIELG